MSNSPLVVYTKISPNKNSPRTAKIDTISIHCTAGQCTAEALGNVFAPTSRQASSNYGVDKDGRIGMYVEEKDRSWCTSSSSNDNRAITIEVSSDCLNMNYLERVHMPTLANKTISSNTLFTPLETARQNINTRQLEIMQAHGFVLRVLLRALIFALRF